MPPAPIVPIKYTWDAAARQYIHDLTGKYVTPWQQRQIGIRIVNKSAAAMRELSERYVGGDIVFEQWAVEMREAVKAAHSAMVQFAYGGKNAMGPVERGRLGATIRTQYSHLSNFALEVESGQVALGDGLIARAELYGKSAWGSYSDSVGHREQAAGMNEERSFLEPEADHCQDCFDEATLGWVPVGDLIPIGARQCLANCQCSIEYRQAGAEGEGDGAEAAA